MIDSHCHLTYISEEKSEIEKTIKRAYENGVKHIVDIGVHPKDIDKRIDLLSDMENVYLTCGFYPDYATEYTDSDILNLKNKIKELNKDKKNICAIGEIGLDYFHNNTNKSEQCQFFEKLIEIANELDLPIVIHTRDAWKDVINILSNTNVKKRGILHCFNGTIEEAKKVTDLGYIISFSGIITYKKSVEVREASKYVDSNMFTVETDAPYLSPQKVRSKKNEPAFIPYIAEVIAEERGSTVDDVLSLAYSNAARILGI